MIDSFEVNVSGKIEVVTADKIAVVTGISFPKNDTVCVHFTYWDADRSKLCKACTNYSSIYTYRKNLFQQFCEGFELIEDENLNLSNAIGCICITEHHPVYGIILHSVTDEMADDPDLTEAMAQFDNVEVEGIAKLPNLIHHYWYNPKLDPEEFRFTVYHGIITGLKETTIGGEEKIIISVAVFAGGKPTVYQHFINARDFYELDDLVALLHAEEYPKLRWKQVDFKMFQSGSGRLYVGSMMRPQYETSTEKEQVKLLADNYKQFVKDTEDEGSALDYNER